MTVEEIAALALDGQRRLAASEARCAGLDLENAEVLARLAKNSSNSHRPPSSDSPCQSKRTRKMGQPKPVGQPGHEGTRARPGHRSRRRR
jgi:delta 1-pyrroline-5-carboxylate dehydrogenase